MGFIHFFIGIPLQWRKEILGIRKEEMWPFQEIKIHLKLRKFQKMIAYEQVPLFLIRREIMIIMKLVVKIIIIIIIMIIIIIRRKKVKWLKKLMQWEWKMNLIRIHHQ